MKNKLEEYDDIALFEVLKNQDSNSEKAFSVLYDRHSQRVFAYCRRFLGNTENAEDVFQETFIRFFNSSKNSERVMTNVAAFIVKIARNLCLTYKSSEIVKVEYQEYMGESHLEDLSLEDNEMVHLVQLAIKKLPEEYKEPLVLKEYEGFSYQEISEITGESVSNIKVRIFRAKQKLKEIMNSAELDIIKLEKKHKVF